ncbi:DUF5672 family protein [Paludisphaera sp.]|uniref:DUF5672 family protein n=1 Tax=Paludisphaera sp. TaxID=2017432 RepID=UPI00301BDBE1
MDTPPSITVVAITDGYRLDPHAEAIHRTAACIPRPVTKLLITDAVDDHDGLVVQKPRGPLRSRYSQFILHSLADHIETDFCIVVQWDGWAKNPDAWDEGFLEYDYIGAPWRSMWPLSIPFPSYRRRVGNGGFSLRSRRWLEVGKRAPFNRDNKPEDLWCCRTHVKAWEEAGCRVAPMEVARRFAVEYKLADWGPDFDPEQAFGFHGLDRGQFRYLSHPPSITQQCWNGLKRRISPRRLIRGGRPSEAS